MKTSAVLASLLFGSWAAAAPFDKRMVFKTEVVTETVVVYTTVYDDGSVSEATTTPAGYFYEQPKSASSAPAQSTPAQAPANTPAAEKPSDAYVAPTPQAPTPTPQAPAPVVESPKPVDTPKPVESPKPVEAAPSSAAPAPAPSSAAPAAPSASSQPSTGGSTTGQKYENVDITIYDNNGGFGACGTALHDGDMIVALAKSAWGQSTYDVMTGEATNPWCGQKIQVEYEGNTIQATIMDLCPGCSGNDIDLSLSAWNALTNGREKTRLKASWSKIA